MKRAGWLASVGGFMDAFAGGGWGTLVTSTLMSKRRSPRYVIGSVCLAEFFVVLTSSITFFILLKSIPILEVAGLILGGLIAAPIAARLVGKLPLKNHVHRCWRVRYFNQWQYTLESIDPFAEWIIQVLPELTVVSIWKNIFNKKSLLIL